MDIPAVVGLGEALQQVLPGQFVIVDGTNGTVWVEPDAATRARYDQLRKAYAAQKELQRRFLAEPSVTLDGHHVELVANIGGPQDAGAAKRQGAEGVGLYRTEFLYMDRTALPSEEEQLAAYRAAAEPFGPDAKIVIRTLDIGGDKKLPYLPLPEEQNPFLGVRAIRLCLNERGLFRTQLRAIVRASAFANLAIMFPMIATLSEWREAKALLVQVMNELEEEGIAFRRDIEVGIMIEIPAAALIADQFAKEVDFFSIGTNDLVQYTMAADRMNEKLAYLTDPFYPAVLRLVHLVIQAANREGKWCGMCGEMAGNLTAIPILLGMGLHEFSMSASAILPARALLSQLKLPEAQQLAAEVLNMSDPEEIKQAVQSKIAHLI
jgi:phosphotransferase system enzyme I (PtsI)